MAKTKKPTRNRSGARKPARTPAKRTAKKAARQAPKETVPLREPHLRWIDSVAESIRANGGPSFTREDVVESIIDAATSRKLDPAAIRTKEALRVAFGAFDTSALEAQLREKRGASVEASVLDALKDSIK